MQIKSILTPQRTLCNAPGGSKKRILENLATFISADLAFVDANDLFASLVAREKLGSTALGEGIAIPHCRLSNCAATTGALIKLDTPVDFEAPDGKPVDLVFVLLVPEEATQEHLDTLAEIAGLFSQETFRAKLRQAANNRELYETVVNYST